MVRNLLSLTTSQLLDLAKNADAETQTSARFLLQRIKDKDHYALIKYLDEVDALDEIRASFDEYKKTNTSILLEILQSAGSTLKVGAIIAALFIVQSVSAGEPLSIDFPTSKVEPLQSKPTNHEHCDDDSFWLLEQVEALTDEKIILTVSEWAESKRYMPPQVTPIPGPYRYAVAPYLKEIADCLSVDSPICEFDFMKGAQIGATVGILENAIGYAIDHIKDAPVMLLTADGELAQIRVDAYITPMLQHSDLMHLIQSSDDTNGRKTGKTKKRIEWQGGGFLVPFGAKNADKLRSISIRYLLEDECDSFPVNVGKDGDPQKLAEARTKAYKDSRKIARISTPLIKGTSRIARGYEKGDQRKYHVPCKKCGKEQVLVFKGEDKETGVAFGLIWTTTDGILDPNSVKYLCKFCGHAHVNADKSFMLPAGKWIPTSKPTNPLHRSYHLSALYSPIGMWTWEDIVRDWLDAWDEESNTVKEVGLLQEFYNNNLGEPFEIMGSKIRFTAVSAHRRSCYRLGQIPNEFARQYSGSHILFLTCTVDVHKNNLAVAVMGWTRDLKCYVIDYWRFNVEDGQDDCAELTSPVWGRLRKLIEETTYTADDGKSYKIILTLIDAGYANDTVTTFTSDYSSGVFPILGRDRPGKNQTIKEFAEFKTQAGNIGYRILVDHYKDRLAPVLRREWSEDAGGQYRYHFNAPVDITDKQLKELTKETRREEKDAAGVVTYKWYRPGNAKNELWDLLVYGHAAVEILAWNLCIQHFELETIDWDRFWYYIENEKLYYSD